MAIAPQSRAVVPAELKGLRPAGNYTFDELYRFAQMCHSSGMFEDVTDAAQAMIKIVKGQELGLPPTTAMAAFDLIKKRLFIKPWIIAAQINACGYGSYQVLEQTPEVCTIQFSKKHAGEGWKVCPLVSYTILEAKAHGLVDRSPHWKASPAHMLYQRAMGRGGAMYFPELLAGLQPPQDDTEIAPDRHVKNIRDLFGDDPRGSTPPALTTPPQDTPKNAPEGDKVTTSPFTLLPTHHGTPTNLKPAERPSQGSAWRDTLEKHVIDTDVLREVLPPALRDACVYAYHNPDCPDTQGLALAGQVLDWVHHQAAEERP